MMNNARLRAGKAWIVAFAPPLAGEVRHVGKAQTFLYLRRRFWNALALAVGDTLAIVLALLIAGAVRWWWRGDSMIPFWSWLLVVFWIGAAFSQGLLPGWGIGVVEKLRRKVMLLAGIYSGVAVVLFLVKQAGDVSRLVLFAAFCLSVVLLPAIRAVVRRWLIARGVWGVPVVIYSDVVTGEAIIQSLSEQQDCGYIPVGLFSNDLRRLGDEVAGVPVIGVVEEITDQAPIAILAMPHLSQAEIHALLDGPLAAYRQVVIIPNLFEAQSLWVRTSDLGGLLGLELTRNLLDPLARGTKQALEALAIVLAAPVWAPVCLLLALVIWFEGRAHPLFWQLRVGHGGRPFRTWKFRTMVPDAEVVLQRRLAEDLELRREWEASFKLTHDPRITRVGRFLRKTSLDELPQLLNVLRGEMALVGPRPLPHYHHQELPDYVRSLRERVRPGMTGLWQVSGRSQIGTAGMEKWDTYYVRNWSIWLDAVILIQTLRVVIKGQGAY